MSDLHPIRELIARVRRRWRLLVLFQSTARAGLALAAIVGLALAARAAMGSLGPGPAVVGALLVVAAIAAVAAVGWGLWPTREVPSDARVARFVEERDDTLDDRLVSAASLSGPGASPPQTPIAQLFANDVARRASRVDPHAIVSAESLRRAGFKAAAAVLLAGVLVFFGRHTIREAADGLYLSMFPTRVALEVTPGNVRVPAGSPLTIEARLVGSTAPVVAQLFRAAAIDGEGELEWTPADMPAGEGGSFSFALDAVDEPFKYRVAAGPARSDVFDVSVARAPRVERIDVEYSYPPPLNLPPRTEENGGDIYAPAGTEVRIRVHARGEVANGAMTLANGRALALATGPAGLVSEPLKVSEDTSYRVALTGRDGLATSGDTEYFIRMIEDRPPEVHVVRPASDRSVTPLEEVEIEAEADDDHGVDRLELVYALRGGAEKVIPLAIERGRTAVDGRHMLYLEDLDVRPGDFVSYYVRARDVARGKRPSETRSDIFFLEVKPFDQEFALAQSQAGGAGGGPNRSIDELVNAQKEVIVATWKLDRRAAAAGAQSAQDIQAVARAEAELKTRVERTSSSFRDQTMRDPRRSGPQPRSGLALPEADAMTAAALAMGRAVSSLEQLKTGEALSPEMEALNHLLRAQADVKRREVATQQAGGGGQNRASQDLSNLFDRELQRQQQTNYETPTSTESRDENNEVLDKVRELARRQDEMLRRQQELARQRDRLTPEQLKRELERLTRDQNELRQRAEELSRQLNQPTPQNAGRNSQGASQTPQGARGNPQSAGRNSQGAAQNAQSAGRGSQGAQANQQSAADRLREASREMQAAAEELQRQDPRQASASGGRALQELQELQRQLQAAGPDERRRAMGDMQLEARQMADEQRQIASQPGQAAAADDIRRRLAGEQERLADRLRRLQSGLDQQANAGASGSPSPGAARGADEAMRNAAREASREIDRQKLVDRMDQSASQMQNTSPGQGSGAQARREQEEMARALDRLAERIGEGLSSSDPDTRRTVEQLARAQDVRDRIESLTREVEQLSRQTGGQAQGANADAARLRDEYVRQLDEARKLLEDVGRDNPQVRRGGIGFTFEGQGMVRSAPGTEPFKQDFAQWDELRKQVTLALDAAAAGLAQKLGARDARERLAAGVDDKPPAGYEQHVDNYFKALAEKKP